MRAVNLLPRHAHVGQGFRLGGSALVVGAACLALVVVAGLGFGWQSAHSRVAAEQSNLDAARAELSRVIATRPHEPAQPPRKATVPIVPVPAVTQELQPRLDAVSKALAGRVSWDGVLKDFSRVVPSDITVSSLALASAGSGFTLSGIAFSQDAVARLLSRLQLIPDLEHVSLQTSTADPATGQVTFTVEASVKTAPAPAGAGA